MLKFKRFPILGSTSDQRLTVVLVNSFATIRLPSHTLENNLADPEIMPAPSIALAEESDEILISLICAGDREALSLLFRRYARIVRAIAFRVLQNASEADDLLQDIFLVVDRLGRTFDRSKGTARFWILQMTYRRAISRRRSLTSRHFYKTVSIDDVADTLRDSHSGVERLEDSFIGLLGEGQLKQAFEALSEDQRQTIRLHFFEGYTLDEIAKKLGQSRGNIKHHYFRGLDRLRKQVLRM